MTRVKKTLKSKVKIGFQRGMKFYSLKETKFKIKQIGSIRMQLKFSTKKNLNIKD